MYGLSYGWGFGHMLFAGFRVIFWVAVIICVVYLVRYLRMKGRTDTPLDILNKRYAGGEITREEYQQMRDDLEK